MKEQDSLNPEPFYKGEFFHLTTDITDTDKKDISQFNIQEIRGWVIDELNIIEDKIDTIIISYYNPEKIAEFKSIILNTSVISTGAKMKILKNIENITNEDISKIQKASSIRNAFAHAPITKSANLIFNKNIGKLEYTSDEVAQLNVMNSGGEIKTRNVIELINEYQVLKTDINNSLNLIIENIDQQLIHKIYTSNPAIKNLISIFEDALSDLNKK